MSVVIVNKVAGVPDSGSAPTGSHNALSYFDNSGDLASTQAGSFTNSTQSVALTTTSLGTSSGAGSIVAGDQGAASTLSATAAGAMARGSVANGGSIASSAKGAIAQGRAEVASASISVSAAGAIAQGFVDGSGGGTIEALAAGIASGRINAGGTVSSGSPGGIASGRVNSGGTIITDPNTHGNVAIGFVSNGGDILSGASGSGAFARGRADLGIIEATAGGAHASGILVDDASNRITASGSASFAHASVSGTGSVAHATGEASTVVGVATNGGELAASATGAIAIGYASGVGVQLQAIGQGAMALGATDSSSNITADGKGSLAHGYATGSGKSISTEGDGAYAGGYTNSGAVDAAGDGSFAHGDNITVSGDFAATFGVGNTNPSYGSLVIGRYADVTGIPGAWQSTDDLFVVGIGTGTGSEANGFRILKDGRTFTKDVLPEADNTSNLGSIDNSWQEVTTYSVALQEEGSISWKNSAGQNIGYITSEGGVTSPSGQDVGLMVQKFRDATTDILCVSTEDRNGNTAGIEIGTGNASGSNHSTGDLMLYTGTPTGSGTRGSIQVVDGSEGNAGDVLKSIDTSGRVAFANAAGWEKYTVSATDFTAAATSEDIELFSLPAKGVIHEVIIKHTTAFSGGGAASYSVSVGVAGNPAKYASAFDVFQAAADTTFQASFSFNMENFGATTSVRIRAVSDVNVDDVNTGSVDVYVRTSQLPI